MLKKRSWLLIVVFLLSFLFVFKNSILAADHCTDAGNIFSGCLVSGGFCKTDNFDCGNVLDLPTEECGNQGGCFESTQCGQSVTSTNHCYLPKSTEAAPITKTPDECGYIGKACCGTGNNNYTCPHTGVIKLDFLNCTCIENDITNNSSYNPTCDSGAGINTVLGCIPMGTSGFANWLLKNIFGIAGGIAFLLMVYGFILIATSGGDEKKVQAAKETITSAIIGLLVCVFSIFILKLIAVNILHIPGF